MQKCANYFRRINKSYYNCAVCRGHLRVSTLRLFLLLFYLQQDLRWDGGAEPGRLQDIGRGALSRPHHSEQPPRQGQTGGIWPSPLWNRSGVHLCSPVMLEIRMRIAFSADPDAAWEGNFFTALLDPNADPKEPKQCKSMRTRNRGVVIHLFKTHRRLTVEYRSLRILSAVLHGSAVTRPQYEIYFRWVGSATWMSDPGLRRSNITFSFFITGSFVCLYPDPDSVLNPNYSHNNPASTEKFFLEFWSDCSVCFPLRPMDMRSERIFFVCTGSRLFRCDPICPFSTHRGTCRQLS